MLAGHVAAAIFNAQRTQKTHKVWEWKDLHPMHAHAKKAATGKQVMAAIVAMSGADGWDFAPGYSMERLLKE